MRPQFAIQAILFASLLGSTISAVAQTGEFANPIPGQVVHDGWELQDRLQNMRSGMPAKQVSPPARAYVRPAPGATRSGTKGER
jgi:hypothetical protein